MFAGVRGGGRAVEAPQRRLLPVAQRLNEHDTDDSHHILRMLDFFYYKVLTDWLADWLTYLLPSPTTRSPAHHAYQM